MVSLDMRRSLHQEASRRLYRSNTAIVQLIAAEQTPTASRHSTLSTFRGESVAALLSPCLRPSIKALPRAVRCTPTIKHPANRLSGTGRRIGQHSSSLASTQCPIFLTSVHYGRQFPSAVPSGLARTTLYPSRSRSQISQWFGPPSPSGGLR